MPTSIDREEVRRLCTDGAQLVEVLPAAEYNDAHLPGAIHLSLKQLTAETAAAKLDPARAVIVYCFDQQ